MNTKAKVQKMQNHTLPSKEMPLDIGIIHFVGIGGIGMSGIAEILHNLGYQVSGSDVSKSSNVERLRGLGIEVFIGHEPKNVAHAAVVVKSTAVPWNNPEIQEARERAIPVVRRSEMLAELTRLKATVAVAGTHGKTTTTSLVSMLFESAGMDPTIINGGIINAYGTNARLGGGEWLVAEADESDGTFIKIPATIGVITNIDPEHLDYYHTFDALRAAFRTFVEGLPFYGFAVLCNDHPEVRKIRDSVTDRRIITYAVEQDADVRARNIRNDVKGSVFDAELSPRVTRDGKKKVLRDIFLPVPGRHNVQNALAAIAIGMELKMPDKILVNGFKNFSGVKRRFTRTGEVKGITVIDDYGHHPTEIRATLKTARDVIKDGSKVIAVLQPHRYTRVQNLFEEFCTCFNDADTVIVSDIYSAGETPIDGVSKKTLVAAMKKKDVDAHELASVDMLAPMIAKIAKKGDIVVFLGAGSVTQWAYALPEELKKCL